MENKLVSIKKAAELLGVNQVTLRRWDKSDKLKPVKHTFGGHRKYSISQLEPYISEERKQKTRKTIAYARVSSKHQKDVLEIITVFSAKLHGSRSHSNKKLLTKLKEVTNTHETESPQD